MSDEKSLSEEEKKTAANTSAAEESKNTETPKPTEDISSKDATVENAITEEAAVSKDQNSEKTATDESDDLANAIVEEAAVTKDPSEKTEKPVKAEAEKNDVSELKEANQENEDTADEEEIESSDDDEDSDSEDKEETDYSSLSKKQLISALEKLINDKPIQSIKNEVEEIRSEFSSKFAEEQEAKKEEFIAEGGNIIDFHYSTPAKKEFNSLYFDYKEKRNNHYKNLKKDLQANLTKRQELIEELKGLLDTEENINTTYNHFKEIQSKWHDAGAIPRDKYNIVWNTYHHHVENFYDFLHLNREFRDLDFKHNLDAKLKLIIRAEELAQEKNVNRAFRELQMLHKMWKEEIGPVAKEYRDDVWDKFSEATKVIHDKRTAEQEKLEETFEANYDVKKELISQIGELVSQESPKNHRGWQEQIKKVQSLRDKFFDAGKVPRSKNKEIWNSFKESTREFNRQKNKFYKDQKKEQFANLDKKRELIKIAEEHKDSDDFEKVTSLMKKIQSDWKKIGHVPRRDSDKVWKQFKAACNHYFDRINEAKNEENKEELANYEAKETMLKSMDDLTLSGDHNENLKTIKNHISEWKKLGRVPYKKKDIEQKFNKKLDDLFGQLDLGKKEAELIKFENKVNTFVSQDDERKLKNEHFFLSKKVDETKAEIRQLENNLGFFQHVKDDNPLVKEVHKNIARHKEELEVWKAKLAKIKSIRSE